MRETLQKLLDSRPFEPFVVQLSSGESYEVRHPEMAALMKTRLFVAMPDSDDFEICSLLHVVGVKSANGRQVEG